VSLRPLQEEKKTEEEKRKERKRKKAFNDNVFIAT